VTPDRRKVVQFDISRARRAAQGPEPIRPIVRIHILGSMRATTYLGADILPRGRKTRALLGYLALTAGQRVPRSRLAAMLWDRTSEAQARTSFRQALRELLSAMGPLADELIVADRETVKLNAGLCWIDAAAILAADASPAAARGAGRSELAALCTGQILEELDGTSASFDQWLLGERTRFTEHLRDLLESELNELVGAKGDARTLAANARRLIAFEPTHEGASRALMRALADLGERAQALREYERCRKALRKVLEAEPSPETRALHEAIRTFSGCETRSKAAPAPSPSPEPKPKREATAPQRSRLRVGVLPFTPTCKPVDESLAFSLSQEIAAALARFRWFDVVAPVSLMN